MAEKQRRLLALPVAVDWTPRPPHTAAAGVVPVGAVTSVDSSSNVLPFSLAIALGVSVLVLLLALTPPWVLPRGVGSLVYDHRDGFILAVGAAAVSIGLGLLISVTAS